MAGVFRSRHLDPSITVCNCSAASAPRSRPSATSAPLWQPRPSLGLWVAAALEGAAQRRATAAAGGSKTSVDKLGQLDPSITSLPISPPPLTQSPLPSPESPHHASRSPSPPTPPPPVPPFHALLAPLLCRQRYYHKLCDGSRVYEHRVNSLPFSLAEQRSALPGTLSGLGP